MNDIGNFRPVLGVLKNTYLHLISATLKGMKYFIYVIYLIYLNSGLIYLNSSQLHMRVSTALAVIYSQDTDSSVYITLVM